MLQVNMMLKKPSVWATAALVYPSFVRSSLSLGSLIFTSEEKRMRGEGAKAEMREGEVRGEGYGSPPLEALSIVCKTCCWACYQFKPDFLSRNVYFWWTFYSRIKYPH